MAKEESLDKINEQIADLMEEEQTELAKSQRQELIVKINAIRRKEGKPPLPLNSSKQNLFASLFKR